MSEKTMITTWEPGHWLGRTGLISISISGGEEAQREVEEAERVQAAARRRLYYAGEQYDSENADTAQLLNCRIVDLPEHKRKHAYSTQIQESIDFLADRLGKGFTLAAADAAVQSVLDDLVASTDSIREEDESGEPKIVSDAQLREAMIGGDVPVHVRWDPVEDRPWLEFWETEHVQFVWEDTRRLNEVVQTEVQWETDEVGQERQVVVRNRWDMAVNPDTLQVECRRRLFWDQDDAPREVEWLGLGRIPWTLLKADQKNLRALRGESLITEQAMATADRYNAIEQVGFLVARYNSHGNLAVIGDGAALRLEQDGRVNKDVADVLTFPGGTALQAITLPSDTSMIEHQRDVLSDALYGVFGLTRVDQKTIGGLGGVSGYALEILNQKQESTASRVSRAWRKGWGRVIDLVLDVTAWKRDALFGRIDVMTGEFQPIDLDEMPIDEFALDVPTTYAWWLVDPAVTFPNRKVKIQMGTGYIVDDVMVRDDYTAGLISRREALRQRGKGTQEIAAIEKEIDEENPAPEAGAAGGFGQTSSASLASGGTLRRTLSDVQAPAR